MAQSDDKTARELISIRETVESIWVAIVLAFVLRAFMIEAFVIPTGSMAPRLMGEHWDLVCPSCGYEYSYGIPRPALSAQGVARRVKTTPTDAVCPNCRYPSYTGQRDFERGGDRVLVMKYLYRFGQPKPWDVVVFRNPQNNRENYIKRMIGLPGEKIEILHGDLFYREGTDRNQDGVIDEKDFDGPEALKESPWQVRRKPNRAQEAMWQVVFNNDYRPDMEMIAGENRKRSRRRQITPPHWAAENAAVWDISGDHGRRFAFLGSERPSELVFRAERDTFLPRYGYNSHREEVQRIDVDRDICSDLKLSFVHVGKSANSHVAMSLSGLGHRFKAELHGDGTAVLLYAPPEPKDGNWVEWGRRTIKPLQPGQSRQVALSHVDFRVTLWVDGEAVLASTDEQYSPGYETIKARMKAVFTRPIPMPEVKIAAWGEPCELLHLKLHRDVYYTSPPLARIPSGPLGEYARRPGVLASDNALGWGTTDNPIVLRKFDDSDLDEFFVLGDNSPQSLDGRAWTAAAPTLRLTDSSKRPLYQLGTVPRYNLIGKAFFVYWPAGFHVYGLPGLPFLPNVGRIRLIR